MRQPASQLVFEDETKMDHDSGALIVLKSYIGLIFAKHHQQYDWLDTVGSLEKQVAECVTFFF